MIKLYGFLWHVVSSNDAAAALCESAKVEASDTQTAKEKLETWLKLKRDSCTESDCACKEGGFIITNEVSPKMIMSGMTQRMITLA